MLAVHAVGRFGRGGCDDPLTGARALLERGIGRVILTMGAKGAVLLDRTGAIETAAPVVTAVDTAGAGDVFCGVFVAGLARGLQPPSAAYAAVQAASLAVTRPGTQSSFPRAAELETLLTAHGP
jgi:ribokinase